MLGNMISVDVGIPKPLDKGLYSLDGFSSFDDSASKLIMADGTLSDPPTDHVDVYVFMYDKDFKQALLDYIENGKDVSYENVILYALELGQERDKISNTNQ